MNMESIDTFVKYINKIRLDNKNKWYFYTGFFNGLYIEIKGFNTWLQIYRIEGINYPGIMDISVKEFKNTLKKSLLEAMK